VAQKEEGKGPPHIRRGRLTEFQGEDDGQPFKHRDRLLPWVKGGEFPYGCQGAFFLLPSRIYPDTGFEDFGQVTEQGRGLVDVDPLVAGRRSENSYWGL
jgi:hypothetical protein